MHCIGKMCMGFYRQSLSTNKQFGKQEQRLKTQKQIPEIKKNTKYAK